MPRVRAEPEQFVIRDLATLKAFADPLRLRLLLELARGRRTVKEVATALGVGPTRLYYHLRILQKHRLVRVAGRRKVSGIEERSYEATAKGWTLAPSLLGADVVRAGVVSALFEMTAAEVEIVLRSHPDRPLDERSAAIPVFAHTRLMLSDEDVEDLRERLSAVMEDFGSDDPIPGKAEYHAVLVAYRFPGP